MLIDSVFITPKNFSLKVLPILSGTFPIINSKEKHAKETPFSIAYFFKLISSPLILAATPLTMSLIPSLIRYLAILKK